MSLIVQKYGGTSVGSIEKIRHVAERVSRDFDRGNQLVVVVSAMAGETDRLIRLAHELTPHPAPREYDTLISTGEQITTALLSIALQNLGKPAVSLQGHQVKILTDDAHSKARIEAIDVTRVREHHEKGRIVVVAGFQGINEQGDITTLGRGGSDTTAVALAAALEADACWIYTDVDGVYTTDPRVVAEARKIDRISYDEMLELASLGAKVLQIRAVEFAKKYSVPLEVRSTFTDTRGTRVIEVEPEMEQVVVRGVAFDRKQARITLMGVTDQPGIAAKVFTRLADANINVDVIIQSASHEGQTDISFTVPEDEMDTAVACTKSVQEEVGGTGVLADANVAKVSVVGVGMKSHPGVAATMFEALAEAGINIQMISTSEIKISCVVNLAKAEDAVRALHAAFDLQA